MDKEIEEIKKVVENVEGWLTDREGELLYDLAKNCKAKGVIVEIGSWKGRSTIWLGKGSKAGNNVKIYAIDPHIGSTEHKNMFGEVWTFEEFKKNIREAKVDDIVVPIVKTSESAAREFDEPVEFIFIDGAHGYDIVKLDFELWFPKVIDEGIMAFHDTIGWPGPAKVVEKSIYKSKNFKDANIVDSISFGRKVKRNSITDRLRNRYILFQKNMYFTLQKFHLPKSITALQKNLARLLRSV